MRSGARRYNGYAMSKKSALIMLVLVAGVITGCVRPLGPEAVVRTSPEPPRGPYPLEVSFDGSGSHGREIVRHQWDFGRDPGGRHEGTAEGVQVRHTFKARGEYTVYLTVVDRDGRAARESVQVDVRSQPPVAEFRIEGTVGGTAERGQTLVFDASGSHDPDGTVVRYHWNFGNGDSLSSDQAVVSYSYPQPGLFTVSLVVEDDYGDLSEPARQELPVYGGCPG